MFKNLTKSQRNAIIAGMCLMFAYGFNNNTLSFFVVPVTESIGCSRAAFNLYYTLMSVVSFLVAPVIGQLFQKISIRTIILFGAVAGTICFGAYSLCSAIPMFYVVALIVGLFQSGSTNTAAVVLVNRRFPENSGSATGLAMAGTGLCSVIMSLVLPNFINSFGWRSAYILEGVCWFIVVIAAYFLVGKEGGEKQAEAGAGVTAAEAPGLTYKEALKSPTLYLFMFAVTVLCMFMMFLQHMPAYYLELGLSSTMSGMIMSVFSVFLIICKISLGSLFDRIGPIKTTIIAISSFALSMWVMSFPSLPLLFLGAAMTAFGMASSTVLTPLITKHIFGTKEYAPIWSVVSMAVVLGSGSGSPIWGLIYDTMGTYRTAVSIAPILIFADLFLIVMLMRKKRW